MKRMGVLILTYVASYLLGAWLISKTKQYKAYSLEDKRSVVNGWMVMSFLIALGAALVV